MEKKGSVSRRRDGTGEGGGTVGSCVCVVLRCCERRVGIGGRRGHLGSSPVGRSRSGRTTTYDGGTWWEVNRGPIDLCWCATKIYVVRKNRCLVCVSPFVFVPENLVSPDLSLGPDGK